MKAFFVELTDEEAAVVIAGMKDVAERGLGAARHLRGDVYEVRADASTRSFRVLFAIEGKLSLFCYPFLPSKNARRKRRLGSSTWLRSGSETGELAVGELERIASVSMAFET